MSEVLGSPLGEVVRQWLYPRHADTLLKQAIDQYRTERLSVLTELVGQGAVTNVSAEYIARQLISHVDLMDRLPAQAGAFVIGDTEFSHDVARGWTLAATELLTAQGDQTAFHVATQGPLRLPVSGLMLTGSSDDDGWDLVGADHVLTICNGSGMARIAYDDSGASILSAHDIATCARELFAGIPVDQHWDLLRAPLKYLPEPIDLLGPPLDDPAATTLNRALAMHRLVAPDLFTQMSDFPVFIVPLQQRPGVVRYSQTIKQLPGVIYTTLYDPFEVLDLLVHEFAHSRLIVLENVESLMSRPTASVVVPWRPDVRSSHGLVHGLYVFHQVATVFTELFKRFPASDRGIRRLTVIWTCIETGLEQLDSIDAGLTDLGDRLMRQVRDDQVKALSTIEADAKDAYSWSQDVVARHLAQAGHTDSTGPWFLAV